MSILARYQGLSDPLRTVVDEVVDPDLDPSCPPSRSRVTLTITDQERLILLSDQLGGWLENVGVESAREAVKDRFNYNWEQFTTALSQTSPANEGNLMLPFFHQLLFLSVSFQLIWVKVPFPSPIHH